MSVEPIVHAWRRAAKGELPPAPDTFFRFIAAWVAFNATYSHAYGVNVGDRRGALRFASETDSKNLHRELMDHEQYRNAVDVLAHRGVLNLKNGELLEITDRNDFEQVMAVVYQVRCNLFHGGKLPSNPRDTGLVESAHRILEPHLDAAWP